MLRGPLPFPGGNPGEGNHPGIGQHLSGNVVDLAVHQDQVDSHLNDLHYIAVKLRLQGQVAVEPGLGGQGAVLQLLWGQGIVNDQHPWRLHTDRHLLVPAPTAHQHALKNGAIRSRSSKNRIPQLESRLRQFPGTHQPGRLHYQVGDLFVATPGDQGHPVQQGVVRSLQLAPPLLKTGQGLFDPDLHPLQHPGHRHPAQHLVQALAHQRPRPDGGGGGPIANLLLLGAGGVDEHPGSGMGGLHLL